MGSGFGKEIRNTIFSGKFALYDDQFVGDLSRAHEKLNPCSTTYDPVNPVEKLHFDSKNVSKSNLPKGKRVVGEPGGAYKYKAAVG